MTLTLNTLGVGGGRLISCMYERLMVRGRSKAAGRMSEGVRGGNTSVSSFVLQYCQNFIVFDCFVL